MDIFCLVIKKNNSQIFYEEKRNILFMMLEEHIKNKHKFPFKAILDNNFLKLNKGAYLFLREYEDIFSNGTIKKNSQIVFSDSIDGNKDFIKIDEIDSKLNYGLQLADFISGSIFREYEFGDKTFSNIIKKNNNNVEIRIKKILQNPPYLSSSPI